MDDYLNNEEIKVIQEASDAGFKSGFSCTVERFVGQRASAWNIGTQQTKSEVDKILLQHHNDLKLLCFHAQRLLRYEERKVLTDREKAVLSLLASGLRYKQIAGELSISIPTVEFHLQNIRKKLEAKTAEQAVALAVADQLIDIHLHQLI